MLNNISDEARLLVRGPDNNGSKSGGLTREMLIGWIGIGLAALTGIALARMVAINILVALFIVAVFVIAAIAAHPWRGVILLLLASQFNGFKYDVGAYTLRPDQLVFVVVMAIGFLFYLQGRIRLYRTVLDIPILGLLVLGFVASFLNSPDVAHSYQGVLLQTVYAAMYFFTVNVLLNYRSRLDSTVKALMVIAFLHAIFALVALASFFGGVKIGGISSAHYGSLSVPSTSGLFQEANLFAAFIATAAIVFAVHLVSNRETGIGGKGFLLVGLLLMLSVTMTSMTRAVWAGLLVIFLLLPFYSRPRWNIINPKALAVIGFLVVGLGLLVLPVVNYAFSSVSGTENALYVRMQELLDFGSGSGAGRLDTQEVALESWSEEPVLGHGVLSLEGSEGTLAYSRGWLYSTFFQSLYDTGLLGVTLMIWIHVVPIFYALIAAARSRSIMRKASLTGLALAALLIALASQASSFFWLGFPWIFLGIIVALSKATIEEEKNIEQNGSLIKCTG